MYIHIHIYLSHDMRPMSHSHVWWPMTHDDSAIVWPHEVSLRNASPYHMCITPMREACHVCMGHSTCDTPRRQRYGVTPSSLRNASPYHLRITHMCETCTRSLFIWNFEKRRRTVGPWFLFCFAFRSVEDGTRNQETTIQRLFPKLQTKRDVEQ